MTNNDLGLENLGKGCFKNLKKRIIQTKVFDIKVHNPDVEYLTSKQKCIIDLLEKIEKLRCKTIINPIKFQHKLGDAPKTQQLKKNSYQKSGKTYLFIRC